MNNHTEYNNNGEKIPKESNNTNIMNVDSKILLQNEELVRKIPLFKERFDVTKSVEEGNLHIEKRWVTTTKKLEIPVKYEEIFINGKEFDSYDQNELVEIFSKIKEKLSDVFIHEHSGNKKGNNEDATFTDIELLKNKKSGDDSTKDITSEKLIPLSSDSVVNLEKNNNDNSIELWGEEIVVNKRMIKLGSISINKYEVHKKEKLDIEFLNEKLTIKFPGDYKEEIV